MHEFVIYKNIVLIYEFRILYRDEHERQPIFDGQPLSSNGVKKSSIVTMTGTVKLEGDVIGKNSAV